MPVAGRRSLQFKFTGVAAGRYAFSVFQDVDEYGGLEHQFVDHAHRTVRIFQQRARRIRPS